MDECRNGAGFPPTSSRKDDDGFWYVAVTWDNGRKERLGPYKSEAAAQEFIKAQLAAWHEGQKLFRKPPAITSPARISAAASPKTPKCLP